MCGRFTSLTPPEELAELFAAEITEESRHDGFAPNFNVAPTTKIFVVARSGSGERRLGRLRWGLIPGWAREAGTGQINARSETVDVKPTFRDSFRHRRCLIPMTGYYEWRTVDSDGAPLGPKAPKRAVYITRRDGRPLAVAGLWSSWTDPHESIDGEQRTVKTCCVITCAADEQVRHVHDRMPVILDAGDWSQWLGDVSEPDLDRVRTLLVESRHDTELNLLDVGSRVNNIRNNGPELIEQEI